MFLKPSRARLGFKNAPLVQARLLGFAFVKSWFWLLAQRYFPPKVVKGTLSYAIWTSKRTPNVPATKFEFTTMSFSAQHPVTIH